MRIALIVIVLIGLVAVPALTQEESCDIDLSGVDRLLAQAQTAVSAGDTATALEHIAEMQDALAAISSECAVVSLTLDALFEASDGSFTLNYPTDWEVDESQMEQSSSAPLLLANDSASLELAQEIDDEPLLQSGQQIIAVFVGDSSILSNGDENAELEDIFTGFTETVKDEYSISSAVEYFSVNDHRAGQIEFEGGTFQVSALIVELEEGSSYIALLGIAAPDELDALRPIVNAIAETVRVER